ncbi:hypothetical protein BDY21DRAFT_285245 [Lineolata rhizophorae]|uniref:Pyridoxal phosphate homeostasis protein n=1 Tax=Lineolata rhizophorae TaxID=578093 RepID=A0A6A6P196_9PEZI|nr:hypothetical protein BDY21DRAFT_285245 [Lineolata rhizophorae]
MLPSTARTSTLIANLTSVRSTVAAAVSASSTPTKPVRLVAVSKLKPASDILALHTQPAPPQLHFGENYVQELAAKAAALPPSVRWHFIGGLQSNKCKGLAEGVRGLWCVESVDSGRKADGLEKGRRALAERLRRDEGAPGPRDHLEPLRVMIQVNTSGEEQKAGVAPAETAALCAHVRDSCPHLRLQGLMTIGAIARSAATTPETENEDLALLKETRDKVAAELGLDKEELELSMGMSADYEAAIRMGSDEVRVGSTIFGERPPKGEAKIFDESKG